MEPAPKIGLAISGLMAGMFLATLDQTAVATALVRIVDDFGGGGLQDVSWVISTYLMAAAAGTPLYGKLSDLFGRRPLYLIAVGLFGLGSLLCGLAQSLDQLIIARVVQGLGSGGLVGLSFAVLGDLLPARRRARFQGLFTATFALATVVGPPFGGLMVDGLSIFGRHTSWRWVFLINLPVVVVAAAIAIRTLPTPVRSRRSIDVLGAALVTGAGTAVLLACQWGGNRYAWSSPTMVALLTVAVAAAAGAVWWERRATEPILAPRLFAVRAFRICIAVSTLSGAVLFGCVVYLALHVQIAAGISPGQTGVRLLPLVIGVASAIFTGQLVGRTGRYRVFLLAATAGAAIALALISVLPADRFPVPFAVALFVLGVGLSAQNQVLMIAVQSAVDRSDLGVATTSVTFARQLGGASGTAVFGAVLGGVVATSTGAIATTARADALAGTEAVFRVAAGLMVLATLLALFLPDQRLTDDEAAVVAPATGPAVPATGPAGGRFVADGPTAPPVPRAPAGPRVSSGGPGPLQRPARG